MIGEEYVHVISGVVCAATKSCFRGYCGAYSHWKFMDVPKIKVSYPVSPAECLRAWKQNKFTAPDRKSLNIVPGDSVLYQFIENESITVNSTNTYCQGVNLKLHQSQVVEQTLVLTQIRFSMMGEVFLQDVSGKIRAKNHATELPKDCSPQQGGCMLESKV